jgi:hypothetical protein
VLPVKRLERIDNIKKGSKPSRHGGTFMTSVRGAALTLALHGHDRACRPNSTGRQNHVAIERVGSASGIAATDNKCTGPLTTTCMLYGPCCRLAGLAESTTRQEPIPLKKDP